MSCIDQVWNQAVKELSWFKTGGKNTTKFDDDLPEMSFIKREEKINDDHNRSSDISRICQKGENAVETVNNALERVAVITQLTTTHTAPEESTAVRQLREAEASHR